MSAHAQLSKCMLGIDRGGESSEREQHNAASKGLSVGVDQRWSLPQEHSHVRLRKIQTVLTGQLAGSPYAPVWAFAARTRGRGCPQQ
jgi:hypothetical protein